MACGSGPVELTTEDWLDSANEATEQTRTELQLLDQNVEDAGTLEQVVADELSAAVELRRVADELVVSFYSIAWCHGEDSFGALPYANEQLGRLERELRRHELLVTGASSLEMAVSEQTRFGATMESLLDNVDVAVDEVREEAGSRSALTQRCAAIPVDSSSEEPFDLVPRI